MADQPLTDDASATSGASVATGAPPQQSASARRTAADAGAKTPGAAPDINPWAALSALLIGFFMILVDSTIVSVATETMVDKLDTSLNNVLWVTSGYLLAYAVPLLITGRLGDRFGPKNLYLIGLAVFTLSSAACGFAPNVGVLIAARVVQGLGAEIGRAHV